MITIDRDRIIVTEGSRTEEFAIGDPRAFALLSRLWLRSGWDLKYVYSFTWLGRPIIQLPEDLLRLQEVIFSVKPDVIVETGIAHGGGLVFYATLCRVMGRGRVIGIDLEIRPHNRAALEGHELRSLITLVEGSSTDPIVVGRVREIIRPQERVMVMLDSNHAKQHVLEELRAYGPLVSVDSYIVAMDGIMGQVAGAPRTAPDWSWNNPLEAARQFVREDARFRIEEPRFAFNEGEITDRVTYWPSGFIRRIS